MSESELMMKIILLAKALGLMIFHTYDGYNVTEPGFPDVVVVGPGGYFFAELKTLTGLLNIAQVRWAKMLRKAGARYFTWKPDDWHTGHIQRELHRIAAQQPQWRKAA